VVIAAGVLGTLELLFRCRDETGTLPGISPMLGRRVRTNSEAVSIVVSSDAGADLTRGPAISSDFHPDGRTHVTQNRYVGGGKLLRPQIGPLVDGSRPGRRAVATAAAIARHPLRWLRVAGTRGFERRLTALTVMQDVDSELSFELGRSPLRPWRKVLRSRAVPGKRAPSYLPVANEAARAFARVSGGEPYNLLVESAGGRSFTAHILGGAVIGETAEEGVIDAGHEVHGYPGLFVVDASAIPVNLGVNPSLTITAMAERFAATRPSRTDTDDSRRTTGTGPLDPRDDPPRAGFPGSPGDLRRLWGALPAPEPPELAGSHRAVFVGPGPMRAAAPRALDLAGLPGWFGKRFSSPDPGGVLRGMNLLRGDADGDLVEYLPMQAQIEPSVLDGAPVLVATYGGDAPLPWRHVRDEFRRVGPGLLLAMTVVDRPLLRKVGVAFALEALPGDAESSPRPAGSQG
jgi:cholesterol oxidase